MVRLEVFPEPSQNVAVEVLNSIDCFQVFKLS